MEWYGTANGNTEIDPVVLAALFHHKFVSIHPFDDGNGRLSRLLMNLILMQRGYPPVVIKMDDRQNYYSLLSRADIGESWPFVEYIVDLLESSLQLYIKAAKGDNIDEDEDIDKEIALLNQELKGNAVAKIFRSNEVILELLESQIIPFSIRIANKLRPFEESFFEVVRSLIFTTQYNTPFSDVVNKTYTTLLSEKINIENWLGVINSNLETYYCVFLNLHYDHYKGPLRPFNVHCNIDFMLGDYFYELILDDKILISKLYHEHLNEDDFKLIMGSFLNDFKTNIKSPKS